MTDIDLGMCDVCAKNPGIGVASSWLGAFSSVYCRECAASGAEPYWALMATASMGQLGSFATFIPAFQDTVMATLKVLGKTIEEYWQDVEVAIEEEAKYWATQVEYTEEELAQQNQEWGELFP